MAKEKFIRTKPHVYVGHLTSILPTGVKAVLVASLRKQPASRGEILMVDPKVKENRIYPHLDLTDAIYHAIYPGSTQRRKVFKPECR